MWSTARSAMEAQQCSLKVSPHTQTQVNSCHGRSITTLIVSLLMCRTILGDGGTLEVNTFLHVTNCNSSSAEVR